MAVVSKMILLATDNSLVIKIPQWDVIQVQVYHIVTKLSQKFDYNVNLFSNPPIHPPREYVKVINPPKPLNKS